MSVSYVKIYYGPYESFYTMSHKPQKLEGLKDALQKLGFRVNLIPVEFINYCMLEMCGKEVFSCNIKNLQFNIPAEEDPVCQRAIEQVLEASTKFTRARHHIWTWRFIKEQIFARDNFLPKHYWPLKIGFDIDGLCICEDRD